MLPSAALASGLAARDTRSGVLRNVRFSGPWQEKCTERYCPVLHRPQGRESRQETIAGSSGTDTHQHWLPSLLRSIQCPEDLCLREEGLPGMSGRCNEGGDGRPDKLVYAK